MDFGCALASKNSPLRSAPKQDAALVEEYSPIVQFSAVERLQDQSAEEFHKSLDEDSRSWCTAWSRLISTGAYTHVASTCCSDALQEALDIYLAVIALENLEMQIGACRHQATNNCHDGRAPSTKLLCGKLSEATKQRAQQMPCSVLISKGKLRSSGIQRHTICFQAVIGCGASGLIAARELLREVRRSVASVCSHQYR